jgi:hypothetical protein
MATPLDWEINYTLQYQNALLRAEVFRFKFPNEPHGYNSIIEEAEKLRHLATRAGAPDDGLPPVPPRM